MPKDYQLHADDILITNGVSEGLDMVISSIVEEGDEVLLTWTILSTICFLC